MTQHWPECAVCTVAAAECLLGGLLPSHPFRRPGHDNNNQLHSPLYPSTNPSKNFQWGKVYLAHATIKFLYPDSDVQARKTNAPEQHGTASPLDAVSLRSQCRWVVGVVIGRASKLFTFFFLFGLVVQSIVEGQEITLWAMV